MVRILRTVVSWGWSPALMIAVAVLGIIYQWPVILVGVALGALFIVGLVVAVVSAGEQQMEVASLKLRQLAGYFNRRFMGTSSLSIFAIIDSLYNVDNSQLWDWARACDMSQRVFDTWYNSFIDRMESDTRTGRFSVYLRIYLDELWSVNNLYHEYVEQFSDIAGKAEIPVAIIDQYNRFVVEYNTFVSNFQDIIALLKKVAGTEIEPPSVKIARELVVTPPPDTGREKEIEPSQTTQRGGYYM